MYIVIAGGGKIGEYLASVLLSSGNDVAVIEENLATADRLSVALQGRYLVIHGDGCDSKYQEDAGIRRADVFVATTGQDDDNLVSCEIAQRVFNVPRCIARVKYRGQAHKTLHVEMRTMLKYIIGQLRQICRHHTRFLRFAPNIHLKQHWLTRTTLCQTPLKGVRKLAGIKGMHKTESPRHQRSLAALHMPYHVPANTRAHFCSARVCGKIKPFLQGFLHVVFAKGTLPRLGCIEYTSQRPGLADRQQLHRIRWAASGLHRLGQTLAGCPQR